MSIFFHEQLYRSPEVMARLREFPITICGAGALGANLTENLARTGFAKLRVIDRDRIEERNLSTQPYYRSDVGAHKAKILANTLYRALGVKIVGEVKDLNAENVKSLLQGTALAIDAFDNSVARQIVTDACTQFQIPCLHVGLAGDYAEVLWNEVYRVPSPTNDDVCDYPLARNLVMLAIAVAGEVVLSFVTTQEKRNFTVTLRDLAIKPYTV